MDGPVAQKGPGVRRFFLDRQDIDQGLVRLTGPEAHHARSVLRLGAGDRLILIDGREREYTARIVSSTREGLELEVLEKKKTVPEPPVELILAQAWIKSDHMDLVVQKGTELGLSGLVPVITERTTVRPAEGRIDKKLERWRKISLGAVKQCGRGRALDIHPPVTFIELLTKTNLPELKIILHTDKQETKLHSWRDLLTHTVNPKSVIVLVGPEGGFTENEIKQARDAGFKSVGFGPRIMRSETAALAAIVVLNFELGDLA